MTQLHRTHVFNRVFGHYEVRGLTLSVKAYERTAIRASIEDPAPGAKLALLECPSIDQWEIAGEAVLIDGGRSRRPSSP